MANMVKWKSPMLLLKYNDLRVQADYQSIVPSGRNHKNPNLEQIPLRPKTLGCWLQIGGALLKPFRHFFGGRTKFNLSRRKNTEILVSMDGKFHSPDDSSVT